jgi:TIR domain
MSDIFISYNNEDRPWAEKFTKALEGRGWSLFWDRRIPYGKTWRETIGKELTEAHCVIVLWSKTSIVSNWVQEEADDAKQRGNLVPVLIENIVPPIGFRSIQTADLANWDGAESAPSFKRLIADIEALVGSSPTKQPAPPPIRKSPPPLSSGARSPADVQPSPALTKQPAPPPVESGEAHKPTDDDKRREKYGLDFSRVVGLVIFALMITFIVHFAYSFYDASGMGFGTAFAIGVACSILAHIHERYFKSV